MTEDRIEFLRERILLNKTQAAKDSMELAHLASGCKGGEVIETTGKNRYGRTPAGTRLLVTHVRPSGWKGFELALVSFKKDGTPATKNMSGAYISDREDYKIVGRWNGEKVIPLEASE